MFRRIVVALSGRRADEAGIPYAHALAASSGAEICFVHVVGRAPEQAGQPVDPFAWRARRLDAARYLDEGAARWQAPGVQTRSLLLEGEPATALLDCIRELEAELVVLCSSGHGRGEISGMVRQVLQRGCCSVLIVGKSGISDHPDHDLVEPAHAFRYRRLLVPLDGSVRAECVLPAVSAIARHQRAEVILGHVVSEPVMPRQMPPTDEDLELARRLTQRNRTAAESYLAKIRERLGDTARIRVIVDSSVPAGLHRLAESEAVDLVAMCAHGYSGELRRACGSVTANFIDYGTAPVLVVQDLDRPLLPYLNGRAVHTRSPLRCGVAE